MDARIWTFPSPCSRWLPYEEEVADRLEQEYQGAVATGQWQCKVVLTSGDWVMLHSPEVMMHFPVAAALAGALDDWGQVGKKCIAPSIPNPFF